MTDNTRMVDLPWIDGTTRTVPEGTIYVAESGAPYVAREDGYSYGIDPNAPWGETIHPHFTHSAAVRIFTEAPEPPVKVTAPTGLGAIVSTPVHPDDPGYVLTRKGWRGLVTNQRYDPNVIAEELRDGARALYEGGSEDTP